MKRPERWPLAVAIPHALGALAVLFMLALGLFMTRADLDAARKFDLYQTHKAVGWLVLVLTIARVGVRAATTAPAPIATIPAWNRRAAGAAQCILYALTLGLALSGWIRVSCAIVPLPIDLFGLATIPNIAAMNPPLSDAMAWVHRDAAYALAGVVALHFAGAMKHQFVDGDTTLRRMLGGGPKAGT